jgi:hypothetical protein
MHESIPPFPNTPSWRGAQLKKTGTTLHLPLPLIVLTISCTKFRSYFLPSNEFGLAQM